MTERGVVVFGGAGQVGNMIADLVCEQYGSACCVDMRSPVPSPKWKEIIRHDALDLTEEVLTQIATAKLIILALPAQVGLALLCKLRPFVAPCTLIVDTSSVKQQLDNVSLELSKDVELISVNPMFAPRLDFKGQAVVVVEFIGGAGSARFLEVLRARGMIVVKMTCKEHDRHMATVQALSHFSLLVLAVALRDLGFNPKVAVDFSPPPHLALVALIARLVSGDPSMYLEIQKHNEIASEARAAFVRAVSRVGQTISASDIFEFERIFQSSSQMFDGSKEWFSSAGDEMLCKLVADLRVDRPIAAE